MGKLKLKKNACVFGNQMPEIYLEFHIGIKNCHNDRYGTQDSSTSSM